MVPEHKLSSNQGQQTTGQPSRRPDFVQQPQPDAEVLLVPNFCWKEL